MTTEPVLRLALFLALIGSICWPLEQLFPKRAPRFTPKAWALDLFWLSLGALTLTFIVGPTLKWLALEPASDHRALRFAVAFFAAELASYFSHRAMHSFAFLRRFHAVHHAPQELDWLKTWHQHPVDVALHGLAVGLPGVLLGVPFAGLGALVLIRRLWSAVLHANIRVRLGVLEHVIASPHFHHTHHARSFTNFAGLFPWLDRLFGTHATMAECRALLPRRAVP